MASLIITTQKKEVEIAIWLYTSVMSTYTCCKIRIITAVSKRAFRVLEEQKYDPTKVAWVAT